MKIIITEEMLKELALFEAGYADRDARVYNMQRQAEEEYYAKNQPKYRTPITYAPQNNTMPKQKGGIKAAVSRIFNRNGQWNSNTPEKIGNWNVKKSVQWINTHASNKSQKKCATYVEDAIAAGGLPRMRCGENGGDNYAHSLHNTGVLNKYGFKVVNSGVMEPKGNPSAQLQPGDVIILDTNVQFKNHAAMWTGQQWVSDFRQRNANPYGLRAQYWIYRYMGGQA